MRLGVLQPLMIPYLTGSQQLLTVWERPPYFSTRRKKSRKLINSRDANGNSSSYQYDSTGLLTQSTDALNRTTKFAYDSVGNLIAVTDPVGNSTSFAHDALSRITQTTDALGRKTSFAAMQLLDYQLKRMRRAAQRHGHMTRTETPSRSKTRGTLSLLHTIP